MHRFPKVDSLATRRALAIAYHMPEKNTPEYYAMGLLNQLLVEGTDTRPWYWKGGLARSAAVSNTWGICSITRGRCCGCSIWFMIRPTSALQFCRLPMKWWLNRKQEEVSKRLNWWTGRGLLRPPFSWGFRCPIRRVPTLRRLTSWMTCWAVPSPPTSPPTSGKGVYVFALQHRQ